MAGGTEVGQILRKEQGGESRAVVGTRRPGRSEGDSIAAAADLGKD